MKPLAMFAWEDSRSGFAWSFGKGPKGEGFVYEALACPLPNGMWNVRLIRNGVVIARREADSLDRAKEIAAFELAASIRRRTEERGKGFAVADVILGRLGLYAGKPVGAYEKRKMRAKIREMVEFASRPNQAFSREFLEGFVVGCLTSCGFEEARKLLEDEEPEEEPRKEPG